MGQRPKPEPPSPHAGTHEGGSDPVSPAGIGADTPAQRDAAISQVYGELYVSASAPTGIGNPTFFKLAGTTTLGLKNGMDMPANNRLRNNSVKSATFRVIATLTWHSNTATFHLRAQLAVIPSGGGVNLQAQTEQVDEVTVIGNQGNMTVKGFVDLAPGDSVEVWVASPDAGIPVTATADFMHLEAEELKT